MGLDTWLNFLAWEIVSLSLKWEWWLLPSIPNESINSDTWFHLNILASSLCILFASNWVHLVMSALFGFLELIEINSCPSTLWIVSCVVRWMLNHVFDKDYLPLNTIFLVSMPVCFRAAVCPTSSNKPWLVWSSLANAVTLPNTRSHTFPYSSVKLL